jgi:Immunity protein 53
MSKPNPSSPSVVDFCGLISWYRSQCDDDWEHQHGVRLETLDNPGWLLTVDLIRTDLQGRSMSPVREGVSPASCPVSPTWIDCTVTNNQFRGACDPTQIARLFAVFYSFAGLT